MAQPALYLVPDHGATDRATDDKAHPRRRIGVARSGQVHDNRAARRPTAPLHCRREVVATGQSGGSGQQRSRNPRAGKFRPTARCDPCGAAPQRWRARPGCASATGIRESSRGDGCSAGTCACPWSRLSFSRCSLLGSQLLGRSCQDCGRSLIPCRHRWHSFERSHTARNPSRVTGKSTQEYPPVGETGPSLGGRYRRRQNERLASPQGRHAVTLMMLALAGFLWQGLTLVSVPAPAVPEDTRRPIHGLARWGPGECADRFC
jgi:hypothetical protein